MKMNGILTEAQLETMKIRNNEWYIDGSPIRNNEDEWYIDGSPIRNNEDEWYIDGSPIRNNFEIFDEDTAYLKLLQ